MMLMFQMLDVKSLLYAVGGGAAAVMATYYLIRSLFPWLRYDIQYLRAMIPMAITIKGYQRKNMCLIDIFEQQVKKRGQKTMLIFEGKKYTYEFINKQANKVAHVALSLGLKKGDTVAMLQLNEAEFIWTYFGKCSANKRLNFHIKCYSKVDISGNMNQ
jgi:non-ribosomal peptide synthetase component F